MRGMPDVAGGSTVAVLIFPPDEIFSGWRIYGTNATAVLGWLCAKSRYKTNPHRAEWAPELSVTRAARKYNNSSAESGKFAWG